MLFSLRSLPKLGISLLPLSLSVIFLLVVEGKNTFRIAPRGLQQIAREDFAAPRSCEALKCNKKMIDENSDYCYVNCWEAKIRDCPDTPPMDPKCEDVVNVLEALDIEISKKVIHLVVQFMSLPVNYQQELMDIFSNNESRFDYRGALDTFSPFASLIQYFDEPKKFDSILSSFVNFDHEVVSTEEGGDEEETSIKSPKEETTTKPPSFSIDLVKTWVSEINVFELIESFDEKKGFMKSLGVEFAKVVEELNEEEIKSLLMSARSLMAILDKFTSMLVIMKETPAM